MTDREASSTIVPELDSHPDPVSEDQRAVREYLASDRYRTQVPPARKRPAPEPVIVCQPAPGREVSAYDLPATTGLLSLVLGIAGLAALAIGAGIAMPIGMELLDDFFSGRPQYMVLMLMVQTLVIPPIVCFSVATVVPMFWYGPLTFRFVMAAAAVVPACFAFLTAIYMLEHGPPNDFWVDFLIVMFAAFVASAALSLVIQMWSPWTLTHARETTKPLPPLGIFSMIELTAISAAGFAVFMSQDFSDVVLGVVWVAGMTSFATLCVIGASIAYFRASDQLRFSAAFVGFSGAFGVAFVNNAFFASLEYGWQVIGSETVLIAFTSLYGAIWIFGLLWISLRWLKFCGWTCVDRRSEKAQQTQPA